MNTNNVESEEPSIQLCKIHKRALEFTCVNEKCKHFQEGACSHCLLSKQIHYQCDVSNENEEDQLPDSKTKKKFIADFEKQMNTFMVTINKLVIKSQVDILRQVNQGNEVAFDKGADLLNLLKEINTCEQYDKFELIRDLMEQFQDIQDIFSESNTSSKNKQQSNYNQNASNGKSTLSILDQSSISYQVNTSSVSNLSHHNSRRKVMLNSTNEQKNEQNDLKGPVLDNILSASSLDHSNLQKAQQLLSSMDQSYQSHTVVQRQSRRQQQEQVSLGDFKWKDSKRFQIKSDYIGDFCLFETMNGGIAMSSTSQNQMINFREMETDAESLQQSKQYFLITRYDRKSLQVFDLQKMKQVHVIQFTNDNEIIQFKQISETQIIIFSPHNKFLQVQNIFDESQFFQIDFQYNIDSIACDVQQELVFIGHQLGKISVWDMKKEQAILQNLKIHSKKILLMDYLDGLLVTSCESGSVKEFVFNSQTPELRQKHIYKKEIISESQMEFLTHLKIINNNTVILQTDHGDDEGMIEIFQNGQELDKDILQDYNLLSDMKIYNNRFGFLRECDNENIVRIIDFDNLEHRRNFKLNKDNVIIGAYFIHNQIILLLEDQLIIKYA